MTEREKKRGKKGESDREKREIKRKRKIEGKGERERRER